MDDRTRRSLEYLVPVRYLDYDAIYVYAPPVVDAVINLIDVESVIPTQARGSGPHVLVRFRGGRQLVCQGVPGDFLIGGEKRECSS